MDSGDEMLNTTLMGRVLCGWWTHSEEFMSLQTKKKQAQKLETFSSLCEAAGRMWIDERHK